MFGKALCWHSAACCRISVRFQCRRSVLLCEMRRFRREQLGAKIAWVRFGTATLTRLSDSHEWGDIEKGSVYMRTDA